MALVCGICHQSDDYQEPKSSAKSSSRSSIIDHRQRIFRIAVQCTANTKSEYPLFRSTHTKSLQDNETCTLAYHVGCARWGQSQAQGSGSACSSSTNSSMKKSRLRHVYYFPGLPNDDSLEPIQSLYCPLHAGDVNSKESQQKQIQADTESRLARQKRKRAMIEHQGFAHLTVDQYSVHESTSDQQQQQQQQQQQLLDLSLLEEIKRDLAIKVVTITREDSKQFIKEQKKLWQRLALAQGVEEGEFPQVWKQAKAYANKVWLEKNESKKQRK